MSLPFIFVIVENITWLYWNFDRYFFFLHYKKMLH